MSTFGRYVEEGGGHTHGFYDADHGEGGVMEGIWGMRDAHGGSSVVRGRNSFGDDLHRETTGNGGKSRWRCSRMVSSICRGETA